MKKICIVGTGYVGLPLAAAFANVGNEVTCLDLDEEKITKLNNGEIPIYEPGLEDLVTRNKSKLTFTTDVEHAVQNNDILFICVGTPSCTDGSADLKYVLSVAESIGKYMNSCKIIVDKSTVPIGTADLVSETIQKQLTERKVHFAFHVVSNPEFMREGCAVDDVLKPDRVVIGTNDTPTGVTLKRLYEPFVLNGNPIIITDVKSAEMIKYASNCFLATKISFINEMANICEKVGANILEVRKGMAADHRIGDKFLYAGISFGGSCVPGKTPVLIKNGKSRNGSSKTTTEEQPPTKRIDIEQLYDLVENEKQTIRVKSVNSNVKEYNYKKILEVTKRHYEGKMYRFKFRDQVFECTPEHLLPVMEDEFHPENIILKQAKDILITDHLILNEKYLLHRCDKCNGEFTRSNGGYLDLIKKHNGKNLCIHCLPASESHKQANRISQLRRYKEHPEIKDKIRATMKENGVNVGNKNGMAKKENREKMAATRNERIKTNPHFFDKMKITMKQLWANGHFDHVKTGRCKWYSYTTKDGKQIKLQGTYELAFAQWLEENKLTFDTHRKRIKYFDSNGEQRSYLPDFFVHDWNSYVEIKCDYTLALGKEKFEHIFKSNPDLKLKILSNKELNEMNIIKGKTACIQ